jgi:hypothetical protein
MFGNFWPKTEGNAKDVLIVVAVVVFLAFVGLSVYMNLIPRRWDIECELKDSSGKVVSTVRAYPADQHRFKRFIEDAERRGETCKVSGRPYTSRK